jgi:hypothetical protein
METYLQHLAPGTPRPISNPVDVAISFEPNHLRRALETGLSRDY